MTRHALRIDTATPGILRLLAFVATLAAAAHAEYTLGCENVWTSASSNNSLLACIQQRATTSQFLSIFGVSFFLVVIVLLLILFFIPFVIIRQCCNGCGGRSLRPGSFCCGGGEWDDKQEEAAKQYQPSTVTCYRRTIIGFLLLSIVSFGMVFYGAANYPVAVKEVARETIPLGIASVQILVDEATAAITVNGTFIGGISPTTFDGINNILASARRLSANIVQQTDTYIQLYQGVVFAVGVIPPLTVLVALLLSVFHIRTCLPALMGLWAFLMAVIYGLLGALFFIGTAAVFVLLGEVRVGALGNPGLVTLWAIPACNAISPVSSLSSTAQGLLGATGRQLCGGFMKFCDDNTTYNNDTAVFFCNVTNDTIATKCVSPLAVSAYVVGPATAKAPVCANDTTGCTLAQCQSTCVNSTLRTGAATIVGGLNQGIKLETTLRRLLPQARCDLLVNGALAPFKNLELLPMVAVVAAIGFGFGAIVMLAMIVIFFKGQKLNLSKSEMGVDKPSGDTEMSSRNEPA